MIKKVLIANRGEIALRIIRACRELGIATVAVYSQADSESLHVSMADEAYCIGPKDALKSYLYIPAIISVALTSGADAVHPGYGFLAERADFADICAQHNIKFIGPSSEVMKLLGDKASARELMQKNNIPIIPGTPLIQNTDEIKEFANSVGYPIILKATAGGGGKGMRIVNSEEEIEENFSLCKQEAKNAFGFDGVYAEKYLINPRHVEVQILADSKGNVIHLGERDCSIQRKHQKLLEEAPSICVSEDLREKIGSVAVQVAKVSNYEGAGTVEFLIDETNKTKDSEKTFYFLEMNTRIQVEHPVTEMVVGVDIVKEQILVADGKKLSYKQSDIKITGHAIECRINAEDFEKNFRPSSGTIEGAILPGGFGVRVDSHIYTGYNVPPCYDSLIGKLICWGRNREEARLRTLRALNEFIITGIKTTVPLHRLILENPQYIKGKIDTGFIEKILNEARKD